MLTWIPIICLDKEMNHMDPLRGRTFCQMQGVGSEDSLQLAASGSSQKQRAPSWRSHLSQGNPWSHLATEVERQNIKARHFGPVWTLWWVIPIPDPLPLLAKTFGRSESQFIFSFSLPLFPPPSIHRCWSLKRSCTPTLSISTLSQSFWRAQSTTSH